jgi:hypothetical protein
MIQGRSEAYVYMYNEKPMRNLRDREASEGKAV